MISVLNKLCKLNVDAVLNDDVNHQMIIKLFFPVSTSVLSKSDALDLVMSSLVLMGHFLRVAKTTDQEVKQMNEVVTKVVMVKYVMVEYTVFRCDQDYN